MQITIILKDEELAGISVKVDGIYIYIFCLFNPPENQINKNIFEFIEKQDEFILLGFLNIKLNELDGSDNRNGKILKNIFEEYKCLVLNENGQTKYFRESNNNTYRSTLGIVIASNSFEKCKFKLEMLPISAVVNHKSKFYHIPIVVEYQIKTKKKIVRNPSFLFERANLDEFKIKLDQKLIDYTEQHLEIEKMPNILHFKEKHNKKSEKDINILYI